MKRTLRVEMAFDFVCPWCLIGLRELQAAIALLQLESPEVEVDLAWRGAQLLPGVPAGGWDAGQFYLRRLGGPGPVARRQAEVTAAAQEAGVRIDYGQIRLMPNTADAHRLLQGAQEQGGAKQAGLLLAALMTAYFERGEDLGDAGLLLRQAAACGFEPASLALLLRGAEQPYAGSSAVCGVPAFLVDGRPLRDGVVPARELLRVMRAVLAAGTP